MQRAILLIALVIAILVDGFFALVNFYPVAPPRSRGARRYIYAEMDSIQTAWYQRNIVDEFNDEHGVDLHLRSVADEQIIAQLETARTHGNDAILAVLPSNAAAKAAHSGGARAFDEVASTAQITADFSDMRRGILAGAQDHGRQWFLPRRIVLDVGVYRISKVRDAQEHWTMVRPQVDAAIRAVNGHGLPAGYQFEHSPGSWDAYDLFVLSYYWAHRSYGGDEARPRIAHRTGNGIDAQLDIVSALYRFNATDATLGTFDGHPAGDYLTWEALYRNEGLYPAEMFDDEPLDDEALLDHLREGDLYFTSIDEIEAFSLHGGAHRAAKSYIDEPEDLGFIAMPRGSSLELDPHGRPARGGRAFSFREESVWMLPAGGPEPQLAYDFVKWASSRENHFRECEAMGTLPLRTDVIRERASLFRLTWMGDIFEAGFAEWPHSEVIPREQFAAGAGARYAELWSQLVAGRGGDAVAPAQVASSLPHESLTGVPVVTDPDAGAGDRSESHGSVDPDEWRQRVVLQWHDAAVRLSPDASDAADATAVDGARE